MWRPALLKVEPRREVPRALQWATPLLAVVLTVVTGFFLFLILGVFAMLYVRERRLWVWLAPRADGGLHATLALSSNRKTMDTEREFETLKTLLLQTPTEVKA